MFKIVIVVLFCAQNNLADPRKKLEKFAKELEFMNNFIACENIPKNDFMLYVQNENIQSYAAMIKQKVNDCNGKVNVAHVLGEIDKLLIPYYNNIAKSNLIQSEEFFKLLEITYKWISNCQSICQNSALDDKHCESCVSNNGDIKNNLRCMLKLCTGDLKTRFCDLQKSCLDDNQHIMKTLSALDKKIHQVCIFE